MNTFPPSDPTGSTRSPWDEWQKRRRTMRTVRWVMVGLGLLAGVALIAIGSTGAGLIIGGLAVARGVMLLVMSHKMAPARGSRPNTVAGTPPMDPRRARTGRPLQRLAHRELQVAATAIGIDSATLRQERQNGRSIAEVAQTRGVAVDQVVQQIVTDASTVIDRARRNGHPAAVAADPSAPRLTMWATRFVQQRGVPGTPPAG